ncbi:hypothetical protein H6P81_009400 [Aristolochia fimbriata]|uniref:Uncharacterized protein n=1 Tax=Aristolochia fimbriata TaxID=158543 RepID=A0AAV7EKS0_ARIFI|nr:hypothetical protein H6P81_009400 [Aristolochia fimbriata]
MCLQIRGVLNVSSDSMRSKTVVFEKPRTLMDTNGVKCRYLLVNCLCITKVIEGKMKEIEVGAILHVAHAAVCVPQ